MQDGSFYHGRNLDYGVPGLQNIAVNVNFTSKGQTVYQGTTYAGYVGLLTGMKPGAFSLSIDERDTRNGTVWDNGACVRACAKLPACLPPAAAVAVGRRKGVAGQR